MPYIPTERRKALKYDHPRDSGELNYNLTMEIKRYLTRKGLSYMTCNEIVGALDNAKDEFKRRIQNPYEDEKIAQNGDVY